MKGKNLGQYFTKNNELQTKVYEFILNKPKNILEPSIGRGDLINFILNKNKTIKFDMYEIDNTIQLLDNIEQEKVIYGDFLEQNIKCKYITIIGNPPYIKVKNKLNIYIQFIEKCYNLLKNNGELIFIVPSDFYNLTSSLILINNMLLNGTFTHIYHPHNEKLFENASIDILIFRYCKNKSLVNKQILYNNELYYINYKKNIITFDKNKINNDITFKDYFDIYVGIVSGKEDIYKNDKFGNIILINGENKYEKYIYITEFPSDNKNINNYLLTNKQLLLNRKIRKFNETNWFEWGALRNIKSIDKNINKKCIYLYNLTRRDKVAFIDNVNYFGGNLITLIPKENTNFNLNNILNYLNSNEFKKQFIYSKRFKIGHRQISNLYIPDNILNI